MEESISTYKIISFDKKLNSITGGYSRGAIKHDLFEKLIYLYTTLGVDGYEEFASGIKWSLADKWYSSSQIERILSIKAFI